MPRKRVLIAHPSGGGNTVAAWALEALRESCELSLATLGPVDYDAVNRSLEPRSGWVTSNCMPPPSPTSACPAGCLLPALYSNAAW